MLHRAVVLSIYTFAASLGLAQAQSFPTRPIRVLIPQTPGAGVDLIMRKAAEELQPRLGQPLLIDNQPAANSVVAADLCARAAPDGHTLCVLNNDAVAINPHLFSKLPYDAAKDFRPITNLYYILGGLIIKASLPANNVREFKALAASKPGALNWATLGPNTSTDLSRRWLADLWKLNIGHSLQGRAAGIHRARLGRGGRHLDGRVRRAQPAQVRQGEAAGGER